MNWTDERYVRVYTRDTVHWLALGWEAQALFLFILRKVDRTGLLEGAQDFAKWSRSLSAWFQMPLDAVDRALKTLVDDGCIEMIDRGLMVRNFVEAQEAVMSPTMRQQESRLRRRDMLRSGLDPDQRGTVVYFLQSEDGGPIKIGRAQDLAKRLQQLNTSRPDKLIVLAAAEATIADERLVHRALEPHRVKGEWFLDCEAVRDVVRIVTEHKSDAWSHIQSQNVTGHSVPDRTVLSRTDRVGDADRDLFGNPTARPTSDPAAFSTLKSLFLAWYQDRYGDEYRWSAKESGHVTSALKLAGGLPEAVMDKVRAADQPWRKTRVSLGVVVAAWNELNAEADGDDAFAASLKRIKGVGQ